MARSRPRDDDEDEDDRPARKRRRAQEDEDEDEDPQPKRKSRAVDEDEDEPPRRVKPRVVDDEDDEEEERPRRKKKKKKPAGMNKGLLFGLIGGGVLLALVVVLLVVFLGGGGSPKAVLERIVKAEKAKDYGTIYDNMSSRLQQQFVGQRPPFGGTVTASDPRERYIELMKAEEKMIGGVRSDIRGNITVLSETINGTNATVRVRFAFGLETDIPFVKENGRWKLLGGL